MKSFERLSSPLYLLLTVGIATIAFLRPEYNWDILGYIATAISYDIKGSEDIHVRTYESVRNSLPSRKYADLISSADGYRNRMALDANAFVQQIPFSSNRPLYTIGIYTLHKVGIDYPAATVLISASMGATVSILIYLWISLYLNGTIRFLVSILVALSAGIPEIERLSTPDALSSLILVLSFFFLIEKKNLLGSYLLLLISLFARRDNIVLALLLLFYLFRGKRAGYRINPSWFALSVVLLFSVLLGINYFTGSYGLKTLFAHTFVQKLTNPLDYGGSFTATDYLVALASGIKSLLFNPYVGSMSFFTLLGLVTLFLHPIDVRKTSLEAHLVILMMLSVLVHFLIFPIPDGRFFVTQYIVISIMFLKTVRAFSGTNQVGTGLQTETAPYSNNIKEAR